MNGRRFVGANPASVFASAGAGTQVDLNIIPTQIVDRIETVSIGGAPIYGADAIAGTVNFILKTKYQGFDLDVQSGISDQGDLGNWRIRGIAGADFRANVWATYDRNAFEWFNEGALCRPSGVQGDRAVGNAR